MFGFREEKYIGQSSPREGIIHFGAVQPGRIHDGAVVGEVLKGYLRYKTITSQNVPSKAQIKNFFYVAEKLCSVLKIFLTIP